MNLPRFKTRPLHIDEQTTVADLARNVRTFIADSKLWLGALLGLLGAYYFFTNRLGTSTFILTSIGTFLVLHLWSVNGKGVPLLPTMAIQHLLAYGIPIVTANEALTKYPRSEFQTAGMELLVFQLAMAAGWYALMQIVPPCRPISYTLTLLRRGGFRAFRKLGLILVAATTVYELAYTSGFLDPAFAVLPQGSYPVLVAVTGAASMCGFFIAALGVGSGEIERSFKIFFWSAFAIQCIVSAASLLLSSTIIYIASVMIGLFWSSGRFPWKFVVITIAVLSFFNLSKHEMRMQYWNPNTGEMRNYSITNLPTIYTDWFNASTTMMFEPREETRAEREARQSLADRVNNLSNLLFIIDAVEHQHIDLLNGATYAIIPPLLIPRYFWPEKPRAHEGQVMLNVHFGRQDLHSTFTTYIAWGLVPEAYGNYGPFMGSIILGLFLGGFMAVVERMTQNKALLSLEGFALFALFLGMATSYEMVASVLVTSVFQSIVSICMAVAPFVDRTVHRREKPA